MTWRKSTHSAADGCCVWVRIGPALVRMRDEHDCEVQFTHAEWAAFLAGAKAGEFDLGADHA